MVFSQVIVFMIVFLSLVRPVTSENLSTQMDTMKLDIIGFENRMIHYNPVLAEDSIKLEFAEQKLTDLRLGAILPKFEFQMAMGPAPGLNSRWDSSRVYDPSGITDLYIRSSSRDYDFNSWGPYMGMEFKAAQPLNFYRYRSSIKAGRLNLQITKQEVRKSQLDATVDAFRIYYGYLFASLMLKETTKAKIDMAKAMETIEEKIDEGDESVSQKDLLELKSNLYTLESGHNEASKESQRAMLGTRFYLSLSMQTVFVPADSLLTPVSYSLPSLDTIKKYTIEFHPDLQRLEKGLSARRELLQISRGEMGPDIFVFAGFNYTKTWSPKREGEGDPFASDPLNDIGGVVGIGITQRLNFWSRYQGYSKNVIELKQLQRKEVYAVRGLVMQAEDAYLCFIEAKDNMESALRSLKAAEAWLKGAAMKYDLDPSLAKDLISPYKTTLNAKKDYYKAVYEYNMAFSKVLKSIGWTLNDFLAHH